MGATTITGEEARHLRWAGGAMLGAGVVLARFTPGVGLPCPLRTLTGIPCPLCGMQTSVKATVTGHLGQALAANPMGVIAVVVAFVLLMARPATIRVPPLGVILIVLAAMWGFELARFGILPGFG